MTTTIARPFKVAIIGATGTYGQGILARAEELGIQAMVITRSPHKLKVVKPTTTRGNQKRERPAAAGEAPPLGRAPAAFTCFGSAHGE